MEVLVESVNYKSEVLLIRLLGGIGSILALFSLFLSAIPLVAIPGVGLSIIGLALVLAALKKDL